MAKTKIKWTIRQCLVLISSFLVMALGMGFFYVFGQLFGGIRDTLNSTTAETVVVQSVMIAVLHVTGMLNGVLTHRYGPRKIGIFGSTLTTVGLMSSFFATSVGFLVVMLGIFAGTGISALLMSCTVATSEHFGSKVSPLALSFVSAGTSVGGMAYPYLIQYLSDMFALRGCLLVIGALLLHTLPCALLWGPPDKNKKTSTGILVAKVPPENENTEITRNHSNDYGSQGPTITNDRENSLLAPNQDKDNSADKTRANYLTLKESLREVLTDKVFATFCLSSSLAFSGLSVFLVFIVDLFQDKGFSEYDAALGLLLMNVLNLIGRLLPGILMHLSCVTALSIPSALSLLGALVLITIVFAKHLILLLVLSAVFGLVLGTIASTFSVTTEKIVKASNFSNAFGVLLAVIGIASSAAGLINGAIKDSTGSYVLPFTMSSIAVFLACLLNCLGQFWKTKLRNNSLTIG